MSLYKRQGSSHWWIKFTFNGQCIRESSGTARRDAAAAYETKRRADLWAQSKLDHKPDRTWDAACARYAGEVVLTPRSKETTLDIIRWLQPHLGGMVLTTITRETLERVSAARAAEGVKSDTVRRTMGVVSAILKRAHRQWGWLDNPPVVPLPVEAPGRVRHITREEAQRVLAELPAHLSDMMRFALETGLRMSNVVGLRWVHVDMERRAAWVIPEESKNKAGVAVPLSSHAIQVLEGRRGGHKTYVFTYRERPVTRTSTKAWRGACKRAGVEDLRWHDLRHTWASWHRQDGTPLHVLQELGAWKTDRMVRRYAHLGVEHLAAYVDRREGLDRRAGDGTKVGTDVSE